jgi:predicted transcriptional regulator
MAGDKKRTADKIQSDRAKIASFLLRGWSQRDIAKEMGMTEAMVCRDVKTLRVEWTERAKIDIDSALGQELERIDRIEREAWEAWEESKKPLKTESQAATEGQSQKVSIRRTYRTGDPRYMAVVQWCSEHRAKLLGLTKNKVSGSIDLTTGGEALPANTNLTVIVNQVREWEESMRGKSSDGNRDA